MKVYECDLEYIYLWGEENSEDNVKKRAAIAKRAEFLHGIGAPLLSGTEEMPRGVLMSGPQMVEAMAAGFKFEVKRTLEVTGGTVGEDLQETVSKFTVIADKLLNTPAIDLAYNAKCEVHMPGQALATYNEAMLMSDACSDALQDQLDAGWRIIAACPQPDQRRPDYILGRFNPKRDVTERGAQRP